MRVFFFDNPVSVFASFLSSDGVISSIGVDGLGYKQFKAGPDLIMSLTITENILFWVTQGKGKILFALMCFQTPCLVDMTSYSVILANGWSAKIFICTKASVEINFFIFWRGGVFVCLGSFSYLNLYINVLLKCIFSILFQFEMLRYLHLYKGLKKFWMLFYWQLMWKISLLWD